MLIMMVGWLNVPTPPQEIEVLELFAGTGRLCRLAKACAIPSQAHDLLYDKHERSSMVVAPAAMPAPPLPKGDDAFLEVSSGDQRALAKASPDDAVVPTRPPPPKLTRGAIKKWLWRLVQPKASGKFKVPKEVVDEYRDERTRGRVEALFEKSGYQREVFIQKVRRIYESVNETSLESNYEFLSEDDMKELGWSERTRRDIVQELVEEELGDGPTMKKLDGKIRKVDPEFAMFDDDEMMEGQPDEEVSESSDGLEEAAAETQQEVLKQVKFPEVEKDKLLEKVCELTKNLSTADEQMGQIYTAKVKRLGLLRNSLQNHLAMELGTKRVTGVDTKLALTAVVQDLDAALLKHVGMGRDICGSSIATLARLGHFDDPNAPDESLAFPSRLERAHKSFELWCLANRCKAGLRSFTVQFFNIANKSSSPWTNSKGSDTMLMLRWLLWLVSLLLLTRGDSPPEHVQFFKLLKHTIESAQSMFHIMHSHPLWIKRSCGRLLYTRCMLMLRGYKALARRTMTLQIGGYRLKPKFHGLHHVAQFVKDALQRGAPLLLNPLCFACEPNEDTVGRICRLSRKLATRTLTRRLLQRHFLKKGALLRRSKDIRKCSLK
ncbi:Uncharacterized protein SCF082_LOCUS33584 [Durusdinium trenchii]|uniref:Uncharacterized protein n=1 Tax=Durusdinium trenchii TaxID=1381693 RepID=A0ABP0NQV4_9DINO